MALAWGTWGLSPTTGNYNYTLLAGADRIAIYYRTFECTAVPTSVTVTYGGVPMVAMPAGPVQFLNGGVFQCVYGFYLLEADLPADGVQAIAATITGGTALTGHAQAFDVA